MLSPDFEETFRSGNSNVVFVRALVELRLEVAKGLLCTDSRANTNTNRLVEASFQYALIDLLLTRGLNSIKALDASKG